MICNRHKRFKAYQSLKKVLFLQFFNYGLARGSNNFTTRTLKEEHITKQVSQELLQDI